MKYIITVIAGLFGVAAAYIKRGRPEGEAAHRNPTRKWLLFSFASLLLGAGLLVAEHRKFNLDPAADLDLDNPGAILCLAGSMLIAIGAVWTGVNLGRLVAGVGPRRDVAPASSTPAAGKARGR